MTDGMKRFLRLKYIMKDHSKKSILKMLTSYTTDIFLTLGFALGIVRVQYRFFIGTVAKRSPEKLDLFLIFHHGRGNAQMIK
jgi:hypothetical protein